MLTVVEEIGKSWRVVRCACGTVKRVRTDHLQRIRSCGCATKRLLAESKTKHGASYGGGRGKVTPEYSTWLNMRERCRNPTGKNAAYVGITCCERWSVFENFLADMGKRPSPRHSIDRIDPARGYEPGNCRWATKKEQSRNRTGRVMVTYQGETLCLGEWAERTGIALGTLQYRAKAGWPPERMLTQCPKIWSRP